MSIEIIVDWAVPKGTYTEGQAKKDHVFCGMLFHPEHTLGINFSGVGSLFYTLRWLNPAGKALQTTLLGRDPITKQNFDREDQMVKAIIQQVKEFVTAIMGEAPTNTTILKAYQALPSPATGDHDSISPLQRVTKVLTALYDMPFNVEFPWSVESPDWGNKELELVTSAGDEFCCIWPVDFDIQPLIDSIAIPITITLPLRQIRYALMYNDIRHATLVDLTSLVRASVLKRLGTLGPEDKIIINKPTYLK